MEEGISQVTDGVEKGFRGEPKHACEWICERKTHLHSFNCPSFKERIEEQLAASSWKRIQKICTVSFIKTIKLCKSGFCRAKIGRL